MTDRTSGAARTAGLVIDDPGGAGRPFVWAHGLTSSRAAEDATGLFPWSSIDGLRVIRYDARGHGDSDGPADVAAYTWPTRAADLASVIEAVGIDRCAIGGASMGCASALGAALLAPQRVDRLVLAIPPTAWATRAAQRTIYEAGADIVEREGVKRLVELGRREQPLAVLGTEGERISRDQHARLGRMDPRVLAPVLRGAAMSDLPPPEALAAITQPALVLAWVGDDGHPVSTAEILANTLPHATLDVAADLAPIRRWPGLVADFLLT